MIILDATNKLLEVVLGGAVSTNQLPVVASYVDVTTAAYTPGANDTATNDGTDVTIVAAPAASTQRQVKFISVKNEDTAVATVTIKLKSGATDRIIVEITLPVDATLVYTDGEGFRVIDSSGNIKTIAGTVDHGGLSGLGDDDHTQYTLHSLADAANDFLVASGANTFVKKTLAETGAILEADLDHGNIQGLTDDDHTQYARHNLSTVASDFLVGSGSNAWIKKTLAEAGAILEADLDHGNIQGLGDDDHTQYILKSLLTTRGDLIRRSATVPERVALGVDGQKLASDGTDAVWEDDIVTINFIIDGGGSAITTGEKGHLIVDFACTIQSVTVLADQSGSIVVDIWKDNYASFPPIDGDSITASAPPTLSGAQKSQDSTLTSWTTTITAGDILAYNVDSITTCERVLISLKVKKT